jgi:hypothetical protein
VGELVVQISKILNLKSSESGIKSREIEKPLKILEVREKI